MDFFDEPQKLDDSAKTIPLHGNYADTEDIQPGGEILNKMNKLDDLFGESDVEGKTERLNKRVDNLRYDHSNINNIEREVKDNRSFNLIQPEDNKISGKSPFEDSFFQEKQEEKVFEKVNKEKEVINTNDLILDFNEINYLNNIVQKQNVDLNRIEKDIFVSKNVINDKNQLIEDVSNFRSSKNYNFNSNSQKISNDLMPNSKKKIDKLEVIKEKSLGEFKIYTRNQQTNLLNENIFYSMQELSSISNISQLSSLQKMTQFFSKAFENVFYLNNLDSEGLSIENNIIFEDERNRLSEAFMTTESYLDNLNFTDNIQYNIGPISTFSNNSKEIKYYRDTVSDGNSFYRSFIFKFIENCILQNNQQRLNKIFYNFYNRFCSSQPDLVYKMNESFIILDTIPHIIIFFANILNFLIDNQINVAYDYFLKSFIKIKQIELALIAYTRFVAIDFINTNEEIFHNFDMYFPENGFNSELKPNVYMTDSGYNYSEFLKEVGCLNTEPCLFIIAIVAYAFDCNITYHSIQQNSLNKMRFLTNRECLIKNNIVEFPDVQIIRNENFKANQTFNESNGFLIAYNLEDLKIYNIDSSIVEKSIVNKMFNMKDITLTKVNDSKPCNQCKKTDIIQYSRNSDNLYYCKNCLTSIIKKVISRRLTELKEEKYVFQECK